MIHLPCSESKHRRCDAIPAQAIGLGLRSQTASVRAESPLYHSCPVAKPLLDGPTQDGILGALRSKTPEAARRSASSVFDKHQPYFLTVYECAPAPASLPPSTIRYSLRIG